jgi:hypothetical protein
VSNVLKSGSINLLELYGPVQACNGIASPYIYIYKPLDFKRSRCYRGADKSLARPISRFILFDGENISFDASLVIYINSTNIHPIMIINRIYEI